MDLAKLAVRFFRTEQGNEPVREWLKELPAADRKAIGDEVRAVQYGWPVEMPLVRKLQADLETAVSRMKQLRAAQTRRRRRRQRWHAKR
jgi:hypothetical protein